MPPMIDTRVDGEFDTLLMCEACNEARRANSQVCFKCGGNLRVAVYQQYKVRDATFWKPAEFRWRFVRWVNKPLSAKANPPDIPDHVKVEYGR